VGVRSRALGSLLGASPGVVALALLGLLDCAPVPRAPARAALPTASVVAPVATAAPSAAPAAAAPVPTFDVGAVTLWLDDPRLADARESRDKGRLLEAASKVDAVRVALAEGHADRAPLAFLSGLLRRDGGDPLGAARAFDACADARAAGVEHPLAEHAQALAAELYERSGKHAEAIARAEKVLARSEASSVTSDARRTLADALVGAGKLDLAKPHYDAYLAEQTSERPSFDEAQTRLRYARHLLARPSEAHALRALEVVRKVVRAGTKEGRDLESQALATLPLPKRRELGTAQESESLARARAASSSAKTAREALRLVAPLLASTAPSVACDAGKVKADALTTLKRKAEAADALTAALPKCVGVESEPVLLFAAGKALAAAGRHGEAERRFAELEARHKTHRLADDARMRGARAVAVQGDMAKARAMVLAMPVDYPQGDVVGDALFDLALMHLEKGDFAGALPALEKGKTLRRERAYHAAGRFRYWLGRALVETGRAREGLAELSAVLEEHPVSFYMALAYSRLRAKDEPLARETLKKLRERDKQATFSIARVPEMQSPAFVRVIELVRVGDAALAKRELDRLGVSSGKAPRELGYAGALLLGKLGPKESHGVLRAATMPGKVAEPDPRAGLVDWLEHYPDGSFRAAWEVAYPRPHRELVEREAQRAGIPAALAFAIMREESAFEPRAVSPSKAYGLMQLIVPTARAMAKSTGLGLKTDPESLKRPENNVPLGCAYLGVLRRKFADNPLLAIPGYNAGGGAPDKWVSERPSDDFDLFVERIPYDETRLYTKRVLGSMLAYELLYGDEGSSEALRVPHAASPVAKTRALAAAAR
jgi:soluble lytic murein transglycosylase